MQKLSRAPAFSRFIRHAVAPLVLVAGVAACSPDIAPHGTLPSEDQVASIKPGVSTQGDVLTTLGTASTVSIFDNGITWIYIGSHSEQYAIFANKELDRHILVIRFGKSDVVEDVVTLSQADGANVQVVARTTPTRGKDLSLIQELLNNVGRFDNNTKPTQK